MNACDANGLMELMRDHYLCSPHKFPLAYYRMRAIAHRYELMTSGNTLFYKGNRVWSFLYRGEVLPDQLAGVDMLTIPEVTAPESIPDFELAGSGYRLFHRTLTLDRPDVESIDIVQAHPQQEAPEIADVMNRCYSVNAFKPETILEWTRGEAYCPSLWLWAVDTTNGAKAGIFVTDFDPIINEACFDWIQLLPEYRGRRIGEALIAETLSRLKGAAAITYVGTPAEAAARFYKRCGFEGQKMLNFIRRGTKPLSYNEACVTAT